MPSYIFYQTVSDLIENQFFSFDTSKVTVPSYYLPHTVQFRVFVSGNPAKTNSIIIVVIFVVLTSPLTFRNHALRMRGSLVLTHLLQLTNVFTWYLPFCNNEWLIDSSLFSLSNLMQKSSMNQAWAPFICTLPFLPFVFLELKSRSLFVQVLPFFLLVRFLTVSDHSFFWNFPELRQQ